MHIERRSRTISVVVEGDAVVVLSTMDERWKGRTASLSVAFPTLLIWGLPNRVWRPRQAAIRWTVSRAPPAIVFMPRVIALGTAVGVRCRTAGAHRHVAHALG